MGGMGGGFRSVPPSGPAHATFEPNQERHLPTNLVSMNPPGKDQRPLSPAKGEVLQISAIEQWTEDARIRTALKRLVEAKTPRPIAQMAIWYVVSGADWNDIGRLAQGWGNASEIALARRFVQNLVSSEAPASSTRNVADAGWIYWELKTTDGRKTELTDSLAQLWDQYPVMGLSAKQGIPEQPGRPSLACRMTLSDGELLLSLEASHPSDSEWVLLGKTKIKITEIEPTASAESAKWNAAQGLEARTIKLGNVVTEKMLARLIRVQITKHAQSKGKDAYMVKVINQTPLLLDGLMLGGIDVKEGVAPSMVSGLSLSPLKSLSLPASSEAVERLQWKKGIRVLAADLSGL